MLSEAANSRVLDSIRLALSMSPPDVESIKHMVGALNMGTLPNELFGPIVRAYTVHGGKEYAREDASHGDIGRLYYAVERPQDVTLAQSKGEFADNGPTNVKE